MSILNAPYFRDEEAAHSFLESIIWKNGPVCPHCGVIGKAYKIKANPDKRVRYGLHKCGACRKQFTCKIGTVFEHLRIPLHKALQAAYLLCASKKGISSNQLSRTLQISLKAAWFLSHRVRLAMQPGGELAMFGQEGQFVEMDETYIRPQGWPREDARRWSQDGCHVACGARRQSPLIPYYRVRRQDAFGHSRCERVA